MDLVIIPSSEKSKISIQNDAAADFPSDHVPLFCKVKLEPTSARISNAIVRKVRNYNSIDHEALRQKILQSELTDLEEISKLSAEECINLYDKTMKEILEELCPTTERVFRHDQSKRWYNKSTNQMKKVKRRAERAYRKDPNSTTKFEYYKKMKNQYTTKLKESRVIYFRNQIEKSKHDSKSLHKTLKTLSGKNNKPIFPTNDSEEVTAEKMSTFILKKC